MMDNIQKVTNCKRNAYLKYLLTQYEIDNSCYNLRDNSAILTDKVWADILVTENTIYMTPHKKK
jgi:hypothetical protein